MDLQAERQIILTQMTYWKGQLDLIEKLIKQEELPPKEEANAG